MLLRFDLWQIFNLYTGPTIFTLQINWIWNADGLPDVQKQQNPRHNDVEEVMNSISAITFQDIQGSIQMNTYNSQ